MALATKLRRALPLAFKSPRTPQIAAVSTTTILCRRNQRLTPHFSRAIGVSQIQQLSTAITEEPSADKNLIGALEEEIDKAAEVAPGLPGDFPFKMEDDPGSGEVIFHRTYGDEQVRIVVDMAGIYEDDPGVFLHILPLWATITKPNGQLLGFTIRALGGWPKLKLEIDGVHMTSSGGLPDDEYFGRGIRALGGERFSTAIFKYLGARGIEDINMRLLFNYIADKKKRATSIMVNKMRNLDPFILL